jgi:hypothetical protein
VFGGGTSCLILLEPGAVAIVDLSLRDRVHSQSLLAGPLLHQVLDVLEILVNLMKVFAVRQRMLERCEVQDDGRVRT